MKVAPFVKGFIFLGIFTLMQDFVSASSGINSSGSIFADPTFYIKTVAIFVVLFTIFIFTAKYFVDRHKKFFFWLITLPVILSTLYLGGHTIYENVISITKGPIHWHLDYQVWVCDERLDLIDPTGFKNKIGTPILHEHNDDRIHVEGVVMQYEDIFLQSYFDVIGGELNTNSLTYPTEDKGIISVKNGDSCPDGSIGNLKVYVNGAIMEDGPNYLMYPHAYVPPGDCAIVEFSAGDAPTTERICDTWEVKEWNYDNYQELRGEEDG